MSIREEIMRRVMYKPESLSVQELQQSIQSGVIPGYIGIPILQEKIKQQKQAAQSQSIQAAPDQPPVAQQVMQEAQGIEGLPGDVPTEAMAAGGIIAFADGGDTWSVANPENEYASALKRQPADEAYGEQDWGERYSRTPEQLSDYWANFRKTIGWGSQLPPEKRQWPEDISASRAAAAEVAAPYRDEGRPTAATRKDIVVPPTSPAVNVPPPSPTAQIDVARPQPSGIGSLYGVNETLRALSGDMPVLPTVDTTKREANIAERRKEYESGKERNKWEAITQAGLAMMAGSSPYALQNIGAGGIAGLKQYTSGQKDLRDLYKEIADAEGKVEDAQSEGKMRPYLAAQKQLDQKLGLLKIYEEGAAKVKVAEMYGNKQLAAYDRAELNANITMLKQNITNKENILKDLTKTDQERAQAKAELQRDYAALKELTRLDIGPENFTVGKDGVLRVNRP